MTLLLKSPGGLKVGSMGDCALILTQLSLCCVSFQVLHEGLLRQQCQQRLMHVSATLQKVQSGRYRITPKGDRPLTYEMANPPHFINHRKSWNSWNTCEINEM